MKAAELEKWILFILLRPMIKFCTPITRTGQSVLLEMNKSASENTAGHHHKRAGSKKSLSNGE